MIISHKYEVIGEIGCGGMGVVYKVRHVTLDTILALKILPTHLAESAELVGRFHREARVMAQLRHPNIVRVLDVDRDEGLHYFVMEHVPGRSLADEIEREGALPLSKVLDIARQVGLALAYAHAHTPAVIHRDVKPSNILVEDGTNRIVVTDFGLAKLTGTPESLTTRSGHFLGTVKYCAPEQLRGDSNIDARVDIYSTGIVMYELFVGRQAFAGLEYPQVVGRLLYEPGDAVLNLDADIPEDFGRLLARATAKDREHRHATAVELVLDIERVANATPSADARLADMVPPAQRPDRLPSAAPTQPASATPSAVLPMERSEMRRRAISGGVLAAIIATVGTAAYYARTRDSPTSVSSIERASSSSPRRSTAAAPGGLPQDPSARSVEANDEPKAIGVMDFAAWAADPQLKWMCDAIRDTLNSQLSKTHRLKVFSKDFIDFKAQTLVRQGSFPDLKLATIQVAQELGIGNAVFGSFRTERDKLYIHAYIVDMKTGVQTESDSVEGDEAHFSDLQAALASKLMARLGVAPSAEAAETAPATASSSLENYKLLLQAESASGEAAPQPKAPALDRRSGVRGGVRIFASISTAALLAANAVAAEEDVAAEGASAEAEIRKVLGKYRDAYQTKDLRLLGEVYEGLTPAQVEANSRYFKNTENLLVDIDSVDIAVAGSQAAVSYTRKDKFIDARTKEPVTLEVRLTKILVQRDGTWKIATGQK
ncbi:MAG: protein kinase [Deltaproteobacteria bacterium]|nr:protein kinase [Deltaproteobacteria bacterium]